ncbi:hypothetical protein GYH30_025084 [Glycine max]|uniref:Uncharacterized protein n=2 Tax=Glycine subgen. Soja TaxID=1462606 RepID=K7LE02_SOYBN|nr:hypothetical protein GYH30_025084 [Glycine max]RZB92097.1 hypothetical protein D0Y65_024219 [Glycine soja]
MMKFQHPQLVTSLFLVHPASTEASIAALWLLHAVGHSCTAFYLKILFQNFWSECPWEDDLKYAKDVCNQVDVPLEVVHLTDEYWNNVVRKTDSATFVQYFIHFPFIRQ